MILRTQAAVHSRAMILRTGSSTFEGEGFARERRCIREWEFVCGRGLTFCREFGAFPKAAAHQRVTVVALMGQRAA